MGYIEVCRYRDVLLKVPEEYHFSFTNSPYYAHLNFKAIDVYPPIGDDELISPFDGKLIFYRKLHDEHICGFKLNQVYVRILHVKPLIKVGEYVRLGDILGKLQYSPTFRPWTDYHAHIEIRLKDEFIRARGGQELTIGKDILSRLKGSSWHHSVINEDRKIIGYIHLVKQGKYILIKPKHCEEKYLTPIMVRVDDQDHIGFLEGGIPYYGHGGILINSAHIKPGDKVKLLDHTLAYVNKVYEGYLHIIPFKTSFFVENIILKGISLYVNFKYIKVIPRQWENIGLREGDEVELTIGGAFSD